MASQSILIETNRLRRCRRMATVRLASRKAVRQMTTSRPIDCISDRPRSVITHKALILFALNPP
jgi:hypothetical protein